RRCQRRRSQRHHLWHRRRAQSARASGHHPMSPARVPPVRVPLWRITFAVCLFALLGAAPAHSEAQPGTSFGYQTVQQLAAELAQEASKAPAADAIKGTENLDYDQYRQIRFRRERTIWRGEGLNFELQVLPTGWLFKAPVEINIVDAGTVRPLAPDNSYFD